MNVRTERQTDRQTDRTNFTFMWGSLRLAPTTSQNTMYCGGEPEQRHNKHILIAHKHVFTKYMHMS